MKTQSENALVEVLQPTAPAPVGFSEWLEVGRGLYEQRKSLDWQCADWLSEGLEKYPAQMALVLPMLATDPIEQKQLTRSAKIAASIPVAQRCTALTFQHHAHVADLPVEERIVLLDRASKENLSARAMRIIALERKAALGVGNTEFEDDDWEYVELISVTRAWSRGRNDVRISVFQLALEAAKVTGEKSASFAKWKSQAEEFINEIEFGILEA